MEAETPEAPQTRQNLRQRRWPPPEAETPAVVDYKSFIRYDKLISIGVKHTPIAALSAAVGVFSFLVYEGGTRRAS